MNKATKRYREALAAKLDEAFKEVARTEPRTDAERERKNGALGALQVASMLASPDPVDEELVSLGTRSGEVAETALSTAAYLSGDFDMRVVLELRVRGSHALDGAHEGQ